MEIRDKNGLTEREFLAAYKPGNYPRPSCTTDIALFRENQGIELLLIRRGNHPYIGCWALPGGFVNPDETVEAAAARELMEETGISPEHMSVSGQYAENGHTSSSEHKSDGSRRSVNKLTNNGSRTSPAILLGVFSDPGRDPRGWTITSLFGAYVGSDAVAKAGDDARDARWFRLSVDDIDGRLVLRLECDDIVLSAECRYELIRTPFGSEYRLEQLTSSNLAFDHAKLIALAYLKYRN